MPQYRTPNGGEENTGADAGSDHLNWKRWASRSAGSCNSLCHAGAGNRKASDVASYRSGRGQRDSLAHRGRFGLNGETDPRTGPGHRIGAASLAQ